MNEITHSLFVAAVFCYPFFGYDDFRRCRTNPLRTVWLSQA